MSTAIRFSAIINFDSCREETLEHRCLLSFRTENLISGVGILRFPESMIIMGIDEKRNGAGEGIRTLDHHVGNVMLYH